MHEIPRLEGMHEPRGIALETRTGIPIENFLGGAPGRQCHSRFKALLNDRWEVRKGVAGGYNCAGLVWSSRRVCVPNPLDWELILREDGYRLIKEEEQAALGDVVVYRSQESNEIVHVGKLCRLDVFEVAGQAGRTIPVVLSKLDATLGEVIHRIKDIPLLNGIAPEDIDCQIYTDRPQAKAEDTQHAKRRIQFE